jgi:DNA-binding transcriptional regulator YiaG
MKTHPQRIIQMLDSRTLTLDSFAKLHPELSRAQIAQIAGCTVRTVNDWFAPSGRQVPNKGHMALLWMYHCLAIAPEGVAESMLIR